MSSPPPRVVVLGAGVARLEAAFLLEARLSGRVDLQVESATRQVVGHPEIYPPGDAGDFPFNDSFLALLQADAAADHLATVVSRRQFKRPFDAVSVQIIEMLDKAAFAELPLAVTGDADHPVRLRTGPGWRFMDLGVRAIGQHARGLTACGIGSHELSDDRSPRGCACCAAACARTPSRIQLHAGWRRERLRPARR